MLQAELGKSLRNRLVENTELSREEVERHTDLDVIMSYITCSCCGECEVDEADLHHVIEMAENVEDFFAICSSMNRLTDLHRHISQKEGNADLS